LVPAGNFKIARRRPLIITKCHNWPTFFDFLGSGKIGNQSIWITEAWASAASHKASLALPAVRAAIAKGRPLIASFGTRFETEPVAGTQAAGR
jgi:hypothetical protein